MKTIKYNNKIETSNDKGELHSFNDKPAVEYDDGDKFWYKEGLYHRLEGPAVITIVNISTIHCYYQNNLCHRVLKPAIIEWVDDIKVYEAYYIKGRLHNPIGPAILWYSPRFEFRRKFHIEDLELSFDEFMKQLEERLNI